MPPFIRKADIKPEHLGLPLLKQLKRHFLVVAGWPDMKAVIKAIMISQPRFFLKITSDREIRDVYVGSKSKANRADPDDKVYNSLEDLMDLPDLVVVRLNELSYKNKAASGALQEAIMYRVDRDKPTWLFSDTDKPFTAGSHAYSDSMGSVIKDYFSVQKISRIILQTHVDDSYYIDIVSDSKPEPQSVERTGTSMPFVSPAMDVPTFEEPLPKPRATVKSKEERPRMKIRPSEDLDAPSGLGRYGSGISSSNSSFSKRNKSRNGD
jgi:hypothetical protein